MRLAPVALAALAALCAQPAAAESLRYAFAFVEASHGLSLPPEMTATFDSRAHAVTLAFSDGDAQTYASDPSRNYDVLVVLSDGNVVASGIVPLEETDLFLLTDGHLTWSTSARGKPETTSTWTCKPA